MVGAESRAKDELKDIEQKILKKYGSSASGLKDFGNLSSELLRSFEPLSDSERGTGLGFETEYAESCPISICTECGGSGKTYETLTIGQPGGIRRVIESCCTLCKGQSYISTIEVRNLRLHSRVLKYIEIYPVADKSRRSTADCSCTVCIFGRCECTLQGG